MISSGQIISCDEKGFYGWVKEVQEMSERNDTLCEAVNIEPLLLLFLSPASLIPGVCHEVLLQQLQNLISSINTLGVRL